MTDVCKEVGTDNSGSKMSVKKNCIVVEISWDPSLEPVCTSSAVQGLEKFNLQNKNWNEKVHSLLQI